MDYLDLIIAQKKLEQEKELNNRPQLQLELPDYYESYKKDNKKDSSDEEEPKRVIVIDI